MASDPSRPQLRNSELAARAGAVPGTVVRNDQRCLKCGYDVKGLDATGNCPECGTPIGRLLIQSRGQTLGDAPTSYLAMLGLGLVLLSAAALVNILLVGMSGLNAILLGTSSDLGFPGSLVAAIIANSCVCAGWLAGAWLVLYPRPLVGEQRPPSMQQAGRDRRWRTLVLTSQLLFPVATAARIVWSERDEEVWKAVFIGAQLLYLGSLTPLMLHLARLADWAPSDELAYRLRILGPALGISGLVFFGLAAIPVVSLLLIFKFVLYPFALVYPACWLYLIYQLLDFALMVRWAKVNVIQRDARDARIALRNAQRAAKMPVPVPISDAVAQGEAHPLSRHEPADSSGLESPDASGRPAPSHFANEQVINPGDGTGYALEG